jgi:hypothetical protein
MEFQAIVQCRQCGHPMVSVLRPIRALSGLMQLSLRIMEGWPTMRELFLNPTASMGTCPLHIVNPRL